MTLITRQTPGAVGCNACGGYHLQPATADDWHALRIGYVDGYRMKIYQPEYAPNSAYGYEYGNCIGKANRIAEELEHLSTTPYEDCDNCGREFTVLPVPATYPAVQYCPANCVTAVCIACTAVCYLPLYGGEPTAASWAATVGTAQSNGGGTEI